MAFRPAVALAFAIFSFFAGAQERPPITVAAAVSLTEVLTAAAREYAGVGGEPVVFTFAASNTLARQIVNGAPVDMFVSADDAQMDIVEKAGLILEGSRVDLLTNQLVIVVPDDRRRTFTSPRELLEPVFKRIAVGDPAAVPAGVYAKQFLEREGLWDGLRDRLVPTVSVRAALTAVESGAADAAIVYRTDARISKRATVAWIVPLDRGPRILYPAARIRGARGADEAARFLTFLQSGRRSLLFERFGFSRAPQGR